LTPIDPSTLKGLRNPFPSLPSFRFAPPPVLPRTYSRITIDSMHSLLSRFVALVVAISTLPILAAELAPISEWKEVTVPPETQYGDYMVWSYSASYSPHEWYVSSKDGKPNAKVRDISAYTFVPPPFTARTKEFSSIGDVLQVEDGWLVGFNQGEWGGTLYWFSPDGKENYKISDHQIVDLFLHRNVIHAIEGLSHVGLSNGSLISISRSNDQSQWKAKTLLKLPQAPDAVSILSNGHLLLTLSDSIVDVSPDYSFKTVLSEAAFRQLYVNSSALSTNETKLFLGMRQFVGELDLRTKKIRLLIPSDDYLHKLPQEEADQIRKVYDTGKPD
jgi:hypothetical protein